MDQCPIVLQVSDSTVWFLLISANDPIIRNRYYFNCIIHVWPISAFDVQLIHGLTLPGIKKNELNQTIDLSILTFKSDTTFKSQYWQLQGKHCWKMFWGLSGNLEVIPGNSKGSWGDSGNGGEFPGVPRRCLRSPWSGLGTVSSVNAVVSEISASFMGPPEIVLILYQNDTVHEW